MELDEGHRTGGSHMAVQGLPAALAVGQANNTDGAKFLSAFLAGYEVGVRIGWSLKPFRHGLHTHGTWAAVGAAVATALAQPESDYKIVLQSIRIASNMAHSTTWNSAYEGAFVRNFYAGLASMSGVIANTLANAGVTGPVDAVSSALAPAVSSTGLLQRDPTSDLGEKYMILDNYFKKYPCCGYTHSTIEALEKLNVPSISEIKEVNVRTFEEAAALGNHEPNNSLGAKFSIPYIISIYLLDNRLRVSSFEDERILLNNWRDLAKKVRVMGDEKLEASYPQEWGAKLEIVLNDGKILRSECHNPSPVMEDEIHDKFKATLDGVLSEEATASLWKTILSIEELGSVNELLEQIDNSVEDDYFR